MFVELEELEFEFELELLFELFLLLLLFLFNFDGRGSFFIISIIEWLGRCDFVNVSRGKKGILIIVYVMWFKRMFLICYNRGY